METSDSMKHIAQALLEFQSKVSSISKDATNPHFKSSYASLSAILEAINPLLSECGLVVNQFPEGDGERVSLRTLIIHAETSEWMDSVFSMMPSKKDPQGIGSCITYMRRYALTSILKLNVDDDDGNAASSQGKRYEKPKEPDMSFEEISMAIVKATTFEDVMRYAKRVPGIDFSDQEKSDLKYLIEERRTYFRNSTKGTSNE